MTKILKKSEEKLCNKFYTNKFLNHHGLNGKFHVLIVSRRDWCEESHPGHPGETREAAMGVWSSALEGAEDSIALNMFYMI